MIRMLDVVVQSSAMLGLGLALMAVLRSRSAALRHWVLAASITCAAAVPFLGRLVPAWPVPLDVSFATALLADPPSNGFPLVATPIGPGAPSNATTSVMPPVAGSTPVAGVLLLIWLAGTALSCGALLVGLVRLSRVTGRARPMIAGPWVDRVAALSAQHGVRREVSIRVVDGPALLLVWGWVRPTLLIPVHAITWQPDRITAVVHHELAHVRRGDWTTLLLAEVVRALYWFNPLVWLACARLRAECEAASDDRVLAHGTQGSCYAAHIVEIARELRTRQWLPAPAPAVVRASTLEKRIRAMLDSTRDRRLVSVGARLAAGMFLVVATVAIAGLAAQTFSSVAGTIVDSSHSVLPGVTMVLTNEQTQAKYEIKTDRTGRYEFVGLPPGQYVLSAALPGFARFTSRVTVSAQPLQQDVAMSIGVVQETITITDGPPGPPSPPDPGSARKLEELKATRAAATCPQGQPGAAVPIGGNIRPPVKYRDVKPIYPDAMRGTGGVVVLNTHIGLDGAVEDIEVGSSTHAAFADAANDAVRQWEFDATLLNCERVETAMQVTVNFKTQ